MHCKINHRKSKLRRRGEINGPLTWRQIYNGIMDILLILALLAVAVGVWMHYQQTKNMEGLRDVPVSEYKAKVKQ